MRALFGCEQYASSVGVVSGGYFCSCCKQDLGSLLMAFRDWLTDGLKTAQFDETMGTVRRGCWSLVSRFRDVWGGPRSYA